MNLAFRPSGVFVAVMLLLLVTLAGVSVLHWALAHLHRRVRRRHSQAECDRHRLRDHHGLDV
ncbi:MAG: hypothetical protein ACYTEQ_30300 [Planctomycetota bacterium]|jgi:hypothetical protein